MTAKRYTFLLALLTLAILVMVALFNYLVNPHLIFADKRIQGFNSYKSDIGDYIRQEKAYQPLDKQIDTLLVGNSRVEMGLNPDHPCLSPATFNLGLPGDDVELRIAYALNLLRQKTSVKRLIVSVDFTDFVKRVGSNAPEAYRFSGQERLAYFIDGRRNLDYQWARLKDYYMALFSLDATVSSIKTVLKQKNGTATRTEEGFNPAHDLAEATRVEGPHSLFAHTLSRLQSSISPRHEYQTPENFSTVQYLALNELIQYARQHDIRMDFFISPLHATFFGMLDDAGLRDDYQRWRQDIASFLQQNGDGLLTFHDFNQIPSMTDETVPASGVFKPLQWFWEPVHYNSRLGDYLLDKMLQGPCQSASRDQPALTSGQERNRTL